MKIQLHHSFSAPWRELELCYVGPALLYEGDGFLITFGLFFFEFGIRIVKEIQE
jgi:hypothetical protein